MNERLRELESLLLDKDRLINSLQAELENVLKQRMSALSGGDFEQAKLTIAEQQNLINRQGDYITQFEVKIEEYQREIDRLSQAQRGGESVNS